MTSSTAPRRTTTDPGRAVIGWLLGVTGAAAAVALVVLGLTGQLVGGGPFDPGPTVRYVLPAARTVHDLAAAVTVGLLVTAVWLLTPDRGTAQLDLTGVRRRAVRWGARAALVWLGAGVVVLLLTASEVSGEPIGSPFFSAVVMSFVAQIDLGRSLGVSLLMVALAGTLATTAHRVSTAGWAAALAVGALLPLALAGHAAGARDHMNSVTSIGFHLVGVCVWVGGLAAISLLARPAADQRVRLVARYSRLAGWCFVVVALSGVVNGYLRVGSLSNLASGYGVLLLGKTAALVLLGAAGWAHREWTIARLPTHPRGFYRLAAAELGLMAATMGLAVALSRSAPPAGQTVDTVTELLGYPMPPPLTATTYWTTFYPDLLWLVVSLAGAAAYVAALVRLRRRGDRWPVLRTVAWLGGCAVLVLITSGGIGVYGRVYFSAHMIQHMTLMIAVPLLWVLGAPMTLALRALRSRDDHSLGIRETLLLVLHSRVARVLGHPAVAAALFTIGLVVFYYTDLFSLALFTHTGHVLMTAHFLATGFLFVWALIGVDPGPQRPAYPFRMVILLITLAFHAFFGISLLSSTTVLAPDWWPAIGRSDQAALLADQQTGGSIAWAAGDLPSLLLGVALIVGWVRDDSRRARRHDRQADRDGDAELAAYNQHLRELADQETDRPERG